MKFHLSSKTEQEKEAYAKFKLGCLFLASLILEE
jgi:hypothetical protein